MALLPRKSISEIKIITSSSRYLSEKLLNCDKVEMPPWTAGFILVTFHPYSWLQFLWVWLVNFHANLLSYINNRIKLNLASKSIQSTKFFSWAHFRIVSVSHYVGLSFFLPFFLPFFFFFFPNEKSFGKGVQFLHSSQEFGHFWYWNRHKEKSK